MALPQLFTGTNGTELSAYDALWVSNAAHTGVFEIQSNRASLRSTPAATACYLYDAQPLSADYSATITFRTSSSIVNAGVVVRASKTVSTFYQVRYNGGSLEIYKFISGAATSLGSVGVGLTLNADHTMTAEVLGSEIIGYLDGVEVLRMTDASITATGYAGIRSNSGSGALVFDEFDVSNMGSSAATTVISATLGNIVGSVASVSPPITTVSATLGYIVGSVGSVSGSAITTISATLGDLTGAVASIGSTANGTFTSEVLKDYVGNVLASVALNFVRFYDQTTGALILSKTGQSTNGSGVVTFSDAALVSGTTYRVDWETSDGKRRMPLKAAA